MESTNLSIQETAAQGFASITKAFDTIEEAETKVSLGVGPDLRDTLGHLRTQLRSVEFGLSQIERRMRLPQSTNAPLPDELRARALDAAYMVFRGDVTKNLALAAPMPGIPTQDEFNDSWNEIVSEAAAQVFDLACAVNETSVSGAVPRRADADEDPREEELGTDASANLAGLFVACANAETGTEETPGERVARRLREAGQPVVTGAGFDNVCAAVKVCGSERVAR